MPPITALLHTENDAPRLGRTLEMLLPCAEILIVDHHSSDFTRRIAGQYGARVILADERRDASQYLEWIRDDWIFCMAPGESINESLQASLFEWSARPRNAMAAVAYSVFVREQTNDGQWRQFPEPITRLIPRGWLRWQGPVPEHDPSALALEGELLRFAFP
jgi:hypothetical protein